MLADTIVTTVGVIAVAWIGLRQEMVRRELARRNGAVEHKLDAIHSNLLDNPSATTLRQEWDAARDDQDRLGDAPT